MKSGSLESVNSVLPNKSPAVLFELWLLNREPVEACQSVLTAGDPNGES
jgi:hypothetical protein